MNHSFIELGRTFHQSDATNAKSDEADLTQYFGPPGQLTWSDLLALPRVVLLSGGGSGKTMEIRERARQLNEGGKPAFFLRIENVLVDFAGAFDKAAGNHEQFLAWVASGEEGWVFLDSVDEARLRYSRDFELAIIFVGRALAPILARAHVVVTGREAAWRAWTDRELIREHLPYESETPAVPQDVEQLSAAAEAASLREDQELADIDLGNDVFEVDREDIEGDAAVVQKPLADQKQTATPDSNVVLIVGFDRLNQRQVATFAGAMGVTDVPGFLKAVDRKQAQSETARPLDLEGLVDYWKEHGSIGSRLELIEATIARRLTEVNPDRAEATNLTKDELRQGARILATANSLMQTPEIRLHDAPATLRGAEPSDLLSWPERDIRTLLMRPLYAASQFGAVRFFVQQAREFLTAEWLRSRLDDHASRRRIEALCFREQYGREVVVPSMRGVLPWLALHDNDVLARIRHVAPEVMFEGGDPSRLPLDMRRNLLSQACAGLAGNPGRSSLNDFQTVQRFADKDLAGHIRELLATYRHDQEVTYFLMRMVWQGEIVGALEEAKEVASSASDFDVRLIALRAVGVLGSESDLDAVRNALFANGAHPDREWVAEAIASLPRDRSGLVWLQRACKGAKPGQRYSIDPLPDAVETYVADAPSVLIPEIVAGLQALVAPDTDPDNDDDDRGHQPFDWLLGAAIGALERLVTAQDAAVFLAPAMALLLRIPSIVQLGDTENRKDSIRLAGRVGDWEELSRTLFWADVETTRSRRLKKTGEAVRSVWELGIFGHYWRLTADDAAYLEEQISARSLIDDRLVALSAAFTVLRDSGGPPSWRQRLRRRVKGVSELEAALEDLLGPLSEKARKWRREEARRKKRSERQAAQRDSHREKWREHLQANLESLRTPFPGGGVRKNQYYLLDRMRESDKRSSRWTEGNWRSLIPEFGIDVATAFQEGAITFWRTNKPMLWFEGAQPNSTPATTLFGLAGVLIESRSTQHWAASLTQGDAELAARYAVHELNGFPSWLPRLFRVHGGVVVNVMLAEIDHELSTATASNSPSTHVLSDVSSVGRWMWPTLAPELIKRLSPLPQSAAHLRQILTIVSGSAIAGAEIAALAKVYAPAASDELAAMWFAVWIGVEPELALPALSKHLAGLGDKNRQVNVAMHCLVALTGGRRERWVARNDYRTVPHLTTLFLFMHQYIAEDEDIERAGKGVYSPGLRDDAQHARDALLASLRDTPGEEAYQALQRIAREHPSKRGRDWAARLAHERATADADRPGWTSAQVRQFQEVLELTPASAEELYDLAVDRLLDYKHFLEHGETSHAEVLLAPKETAVRNMVANWCKERGLGRYLIAQEEEFADSKRTDFRFRSVAFDNPVPVELKLSNLWSGPELIERLENQLCNDYLRDERSRRGIFLLMHQGKKRYWDLPDGSRANSVAQLADALQSHWEKSKNDFPLVQAVRVVGIDLTLRSKPMGRSAKKKTDKAASSKVAAKRPAKPRASSAKRPKSAGTPRRSTAKSSAASGINKATSGSRGRAGATAKQVVKVPKKTVAKKTRTKTSAKKNVATAGRSTTARSKGASTAAKRPTARDTEPRSAAKKAKVTARKPRSAVVRPAAKRKPKRATAPIVRRR